MVARGEVEQERPRVAEGRGVGQGRMPLAHLACFREATYRLLSQAFLYPDEARVAAVADAAGNLQQEGHTLTQFAFFGQWSQLLSAMQELGRRRTAKAQGEYVSMFVVNSGELPCPPYESVYREASGRPTGWLLAEVERDYAAVGLAPSPDLGELPDHVAVELEFMAILCDREAEAWEGKRLEWGIESLRRQKSFLDSHLALWLPEFARQVAAADTGGVYAALSRGAQAFIGYDRDLLGALLDTVAVAPKAS